MKEKSSPIPALGRLICGVQPYAWGDKQWIRDLLSGVEPALRPELVAENEPMAELWMGAHPELPARFESGVGAGQLDQLISQAPDSMLGAAVVQRFGTRLPYLFKVLSAGEPLSIQVHPSLEQARAGFARETRAGIPLTAPERNYKDDNHKPELIVALTPFHALRGFRRFEEIETTLRQDPTLAAMAGDFRPNEASLRQLYGRVMRASPAQIDAWLGPWVERLQVANASRSFTKREAEYWVLRAHEVYSVGDHYDRGLFSILLLNLIELAPGEALFLDAGVLHAYLLGTGIELMANSNNVLRGGLTPKHVDVEELLATVRFEEEIPPILSPDPLPGSAPGSESAGCFRTSAPEFELWRIALEGRPDAQQKFQSRARSGEIWLAAAGKGHGRISVGERSVEIRKGVVTWVGAGAEYRIDGHDLELFRAGVGRWG